MGPTRGLGGHPTRQPQWINLQSDVVCAVRQADSLLLFIGGVDQACLFALISSSDTAVIQQWIRGIATSSVHTWAPRNYGDS